MLADFVFYVAVVGVEFFEGGGEVVGIGGGELGFAEAAEGGEDVEGPAALFDGDFLEGFDAAELRADLGGGDGVVVGDNRDSGFEGDSV